MGTRRDVMAGLTVSALAALASRRAAHAAPAEFNLSVAMGADPVNLDPRKTWVAQGYSINAHMFEPLVFRTEQSGNVVLTPLLAESWQQTTPTVLELKIRQGVTFQNGEDLDAAAVAYTLTSIMDPKFVTNLRLWTGDIADVVVKDKFTIAITTKSQIRGLLNSLAQLPIVAPKAAQDDPAGFDKKPIGTGAYRLVSYVPSSQVKIERFDHYWGTPGKAKTITFRVMPENAVRVAALQAGEVHVSENLPPDKLPGLREEKDVKVLFTPTLRVNYLTLNFRNPIMQNQKFREALSLAIDRDSLVKNLLAGTTKPANSISPPGTIGYDASLPAYAYDPARAKALLKEAGYNNEPITMGGPIGRYSMDKQVNEARAAMFTSIFG